MEIWKVIKGYEKYQVSNLGRVKSFFSKEKILKLRNHRGYSLVNLSNKTFKVHRLVAEAFLENETKKPEVNHKNKIKSDNTVSNLEWVTREENIYHRDGKSNMVLFSKLIKEQINNIIKLN